MVKGSWLVAVAVVEESIWLGSDRGEELAGSCGSDGRERFAGSCGSDGGEESASCYGSDRRRS